MRRGAIFWGCLLIILGVILILNTLEILSVNIWGIAFSIFIIGLGAWILMGTFTKRSYKKEPVKISLEDVKLAKIRIKHGAGRLEITSGAEEGNLVSGSCVGGAIIRSQIKSEFQDVSISVPDMSFSWFEWGPGTSLDWSLQLAEGFPIEMYLDTGASETRIDLRRLLVSHLQYNSGASSTQITLPENSGFTKGVFKTGAAALELFVPSGVAARIHTSGGLASIKVDSSRFPRTGAYYQSLGYDTSVNKIDIQVETGVGSVDIR